MADSSKKDEYDIFIAQSIYPEAASIFTFQLKSLEEIKDDCYIVLDTNVLLAPYIIGKEDPGKDNLLESCQKIYQSLIEKKRLIIPGQVAREFAHRRVDKVAELYQQLSEKKGKIQQIPKGKYPLLNALSEYQQVELLQEEINQKIREYQRAVNQVLAHVQNWQLDDPVRSLYSQIIDESVIFDPHLDKEEMKKDLLRRQLHHIPPGYKDAGKDDRGIGDVLIWYTILELGKVQKKNVIFVSGDEKPDWFKQSQNVALHLRYELIDEFRRNSGGCSLQVIKFSRFLELYDAEEEIIERVKQEEAQIDESSRARKYYLDQLLILMISFLNAWKSLPREESMVTQPGYITNVRSTAARIVIDLNDILSHARVQNLLDEELARKLLDIMASLQILEAKPLFLDGGKSLKEFNDLANAIASNMENLLEEIRGRILRL